jgi:hypothetical protein
MNRVDFLATAVTAAALGAMILPMVTGPGAVIPLLVGILVVARIIALWAAWAAAWLQERFA